MKNEINAKIIADSTNEHGQRITTYVLTYPRFIHAECKTHRVLSNDDSFYEDTSLMNEEMFSRNAASSRAIPAAKMIKDIEEDPFIPVAFQKAHSGMQGTEYFEGDDERLMRLRWTNSLKNSILSARTLLEEGLTKQIINRILEPYQWYTCIVTATEYDNFFELRCPQYEFNGVKHKSKKDCIKYYEDDEVQARLSNHSDLEWLKLNKGQGEIHISLLAEAMWDARNESKPKQLKVGEWHIPFGDKFDSARICELYKGEERHIPFNFIQDCRMKIATSRCARVSYLNFEGKDNYEADIKLYDRLKAMGHLSPFEHCARAMSKDEFYTHSHNTGVNADEIRSIGWSGNFRGFVQLRKEIEE